MAELLSDEYLGAVVDAIEAMPNRIQGFLYGKDHVVRDVWRPAAQQELWRRPASEETDAPLMRQCEIERLRLAFQAVAQARGEPTYPADKVPMPQNADQAVGMWLVGESWVRENAPDRLVSKGSTPAGITGDLPGDAGDPA